MMQLTKEGGGGGGGGEEDVCRKCGEEDDDDEFSCLRCKKGVFKVPARLLAPSRVDQLQAHRHDISRNNDSVEIPYGYIQSEELRQMILEFTNNNRYPAEFRQLCNQSKILYGLLRRKRVTETIRPYYNQLVALHRQCVEWVNLQKERRRNIMHHPKLNNYYIVLIGSVTYIWINIAYKSLNQVTERVQKANAHLQHIKKLHSQRRCVKVVAADVASQSTFT